MWNAEDGRTSTGAVMVRREWAAGSDGRAAHSLSPAALRSRYRLPHAPCRDRSATPPHRARRRSRASSASGAPSPCRRLDDRLRDLPLAGRHRRPAPGPAAAHGRVGRRRTVRAVRRAHARRGVRRVSGDGRDLRLHPRRRGDGCPAFLFGWAELVAHPRGVARRDQHDVRRVLLRVLGYDPSRGAVHATTCTTSPRVAIALTATFNYVGAAMGLARAEPHDAREVRRPAVHHPARVRIGLPQTGGHFTPAVPAGQLLTSRAFGLALVSVLWAFDGWADLTLRLRRGEGSARRRCRARSSSARSRVIAHLPAGEPRLSGGDAGRGDPAVEARRGGRRAAADRRAGRDVRRHRR